VKTEKKKEEGKRVLSGIGGATNSNNRTQNPNRRNRTTNSNANSKKQLKSDCQPSHLLTNQKTNGRTLEV
jgi:hypothetical protein